MFIGQLRKAFNVKNSSQNFREDAENGKKNQAFNIHGGKNVNPLKKRKQHLDNEKVF